MVWDTPPLPFWSVALPPAVDVTYSSVSFLLSSMKAMDSDLRRLVTSYVLRVTPKMSSWYRLSSYGQKQPGGGSNSWEGLGEGQSDIQGNIYLEKAKAELKALRWWLAVLCPLEPGRQRIYGIFGKRVAS